MLRPASVLNGFGDRCPGGGIIRRRQLQHPSPFAKLRDLERHGAFKRIEQHQHVVPDAVLLLKIRPADGDPER
jgi:hypothetical protein